MTLLSLPAPFRDRDPQSGKSFWAVILRAVALTIGLLIMAAGIPLALLPGHLGLPLLMIGLIVVLRSSMPARRRFIHLQRRHPKVVFPIRRLLRREPEVFPVAWQQVLRVERMILPRRWRMAKAMRRRLRLGRRF